MKNEKCPSCHLDVTPENLDKYISTDMESAHYVLCPHCNELFYITEDGQENKRCDFKAFRVACQKDTKTLRVACQKEMKTLREIMKRIYSGCVRNNGN